LMSGKIKTSGGQKLDYHKSISIRLKVNPTVALKQGDKRVGKVIVAEVRKNKLAATEGMTLDTRLIFGEGFSAKEDAFQQALDDGIITKDGGNYHFKGEKIAYGENRAKKWFEENKNLLTP